MLPEALIVHRAHGRLRLKIPSRKRDRAYFSLVERGLSHYPGVEGVEVNPTTGSVLLHHHLDIRAFAEQAAMDGFFKLRTARRQGVPLHAKVLDSFSDLDGQIKDLTRGELDIASFVFAGLLGIGIYQISVGNFTAPAWYTAFWYAMNTAFKARAGVRNEGE